MAKKMSSRRRTITLTRDGNSLKLKTVFEPGMEFESTLKLNEVNDIKDKEENPRYHIKVPTCENEYMHSVWFSVSFDHYATSWLNIKHSNFHLK